MTSRLLTAAAAIAVAVNLFAVAPAAHAAPVVQVFSSCAAVHRVYPGGIAKNGVHANTIHRHGMYHRALRGQVEFSTALYEANRRRDNDGDGIACELSGGRNLD